MASHRSDFCGQPGVGPPVQGLGASSDGAPAGLVSSACCLLPLQGRPRAELVGKGAAARPCSLLGSRSGRPGRPEPFARGMKFSLSTHTHPREQQKIVFLLSVFGSLTGHRLPWLFVLNASQQVCLVPNLLADFTLST